MNKKVTNNATLKCTLGTMSSKIKVTSQSISKIEDELICTEGDKEGMKNILSFGKCKRSWYKPPCIPNPIQWENISTKNKIIGLAKLTEISTCKCSQGGEISFIDTGSNTHVYSE